MFELARPVSQCSEPKSGRREPEAIPRDEIGVVAQS
jgi:hypothetical protein